MPLNLIKTQKQISDFLIEIHQTRSDFSGALIDKIYIPPYEFETIQKNLQNDRIVFITGPAGYGKTYTAIRLLWEWYNKGYAPKWVPGKEDKQRENVRDKLANIDAELKSHHIIYFEDPFGVTKYERRDDLKERINSIIFYGEWRRGDIDFLNLRTYFQNDGDNKPTLPDYNGE